VQHVAHAIEDLKRALRHQAMQTRRLRGDLDGFCRKVGFLLRLSNTELLNITRLLVSTSAINRTLRQNHILSRGRPSSPADVRSSGPERAGRVQQPSYRRFAGFFFASCCLSVMTSFKALVWCRSCSFNSPSR
jgi:hypothetical protein